MINGKLWAHEVQTFVNRLVADGERAEEAFEIISNTTGFSTEVIEELYYGKVAVVL